jgi:hypothetical protein
MWNERTAIAYTKLSETSEDNEITEFSNQQIRWKSCNASNLPLYLYGQMGPVCRLMFAQNLTEECERETPVYRRPLTKFSEFERENKGHATDYGGVTDRLSRWLQKWFLVILPIAPGLLI